MASQPMVMAPTSAPEMIVAENANEESIKIEGMTFSRKEVESPRIIDDRLDEIAETLAKDLYYSRYYAENRVMDLNEINGIFEKMAEADSLEEMNSIGNRQIGQYGASIDSLEEYDVDPAIESFLRSLKDKAEEQDWTIGFEKETDEGDESIRDLREAMVEICLENDDSVPADMLGHCDRVEICFVFGPQTGYFSDYEIDADRYNDYDSLELTQGLLETLPRLGYTLTDYRKHSGNKNKRRDAISKTKKRSVPLITLDDFKEIVENTGSSNFHIGIYAQVALKDLLTIDFTKPIVLDKHSVCSINKNNGCFFDHHIKEPVIIKPQDGKWMGFDGNKGPSNWCGLSNSYYHAEVSQ